MEAGFFGGAAMSLRNTTKITPAPQRNRWLTLLSTALVAVGIVIALVAGLSLIPQISDDAAAGRSPGQEARP
jgi:hypothetical protein